MVEPMTDAELEHLKSVALHGPVPALTVARLVARLDQVEAEDSRIQMLLEEKREATQRWTRDRRDQLRLMEQLRAERDRYKAKADLFQHIERCEQCQGPDDGCETGQCFEFMT